MPTGQYRITEGSHNHRGERFVAGDVIDDLPEGLARHFPHKFEAVGDANADAGGDTDTDAEAEPDTEPEVVDSDTDTAEDDDNGNDNVAVGEAESDDEDEAKDEAEANAERAPDSYPDADVESGSEAEDPEIPDDFGTLRRIASVHDFDDHGVDGRSSKDDIVTAIESLPEDERAELLREHGGV